MSINNQNTYLNIEDAHLRLRTGNVYAQGITIGGITVDPSHGLQRVSDTGNATTNTLQFDNATTAFTTTANITVGRDLTVTGNATVSSNLTVTGNAVISDDLTVTENLLVSNNLTVTGNTFYTNPAAVLVDSNVVTEYTGPHDRPLRKYPEVAMTQNDESATSGYVASASSTATYNTDLQPENVFNGVISPSSGTAAWQSSDSGYSGTTPFDYLNSGTHTKFLTDTDGTIHRGDWLSLQTPNRIKVSYYKIHTLNDVDNYRPDSFVLLGSNSETDGTWKLLHTETNGMSDPGPEVYTGHVNSTEFYKYHRLLVKSLAGNGGEIYINELEYYGYEEGSGSLDTTLKSVYNVPATTGTQLEVYYDGQETSSYSGSGTTVNDLAGTQQNGTLNGGVGFDPTYKAFTFDGTTTRNITATLPSTVTGEYVHSVSLWVKADEVSRSAGTGMFTFFTIGSASGTNMIALGVNLNSDGIKYDFYDAGAHVNSPPITSNEWMHFVVTYSGGANNLAGAKGIYLNGKELVISEYGGNSVSSPLSLPTSPTLTLGGQLNSGNPPFSGSIANFRLYSKALNADQVKELYDYQKDYFLGSKSQVTLYKGHLGLGVAEPSGQLELAGDERLQEYPPRALTGYSTHIEGHGVFGLHHTPGTGASGAVVNAFNKSATTADFWYSTIQVWTPGGQNVAGPFNYTGTHSIAGISGEWVYITLPYHVNMKYLQITARNGEVGSAPNSAIIIGSSDGGRTWEQVGSWSDKTSSNFWLDGGVPSPTFTINSTKPLNAIGFVVTEANSWYAFTLGEIKFFGTPGPTTLDKGSLTLGRSLDVPRVSRYDVDTETPRPEKLVVDFDTTVNSSPTDISGRGIMGRFTTVPPTPQRIRRLILMGQMII
jgi:hypothetical protein